MTSTAHDESDGNPRWRSRPRGPWGFWSGGGCGWQQASWRSRDGEGSWNAQSWGPRWGASHPFWGPLFIPKPLLIVATILGFMLWWPIGLVLLMVTLCRRHMFWSYPHWRGWQSASAGPGAGWKSWFGAEAPPTGPSSGNRAFDEYRAETLHRLEEEQKEFAEFLDRLRFAKDKSEFDQFMNERRDRPSGTPPEPPPQPAN